jgi:predicted nucleotidyltransferase
MSGPPIAGTPEEWGILRYIPRQHLPNCEVWAFGSRARRGAKPFSDLDLAIIGETPMDDIGALKDALCESDLPFRVDIVEWARLDATFQRIVEAGRVIVQTSSTPTKRVPTY